MPDVTKTKKNHFWGALVGRRQKNNGVIPHLDRRLSLPYQVAEPQPLYSQLDPASRSIRLITILPGPWSDPMSCLLSVAQLPVGQAPAPRRYWALSYAWKNNDGAEDVPIRINGFVVTVSGNLFAAIRRLRHRAREPLDIWIDSLCINQKDDVERTHQVSIMRDIYRHSEEVIIWLGEASASDDLGHAVLLPFINVNGSGKDAPSAPSKGPARDAAAPITIEWFADERDRPKVTAYVRSVAANASSPLLSSGRRDILGAFAVIYLLSERVPASQIKHLRHIDYSTPIVRGLYAIMEMPWWRRTWVVQETVVAKKATIYYGAMSAPWDMFSRAALEYDRTHLLAKANSVYPYLRDGKPLVHFARTVSEIESTRRLWEGVNTSLLPLLRDFRSREATDGRDKVFALIGLARNWGRGIRVTPDYRMRPSQVLWETATRLIAGTQSLSVIAGTLQQDSSRWALNPSWIPDWSCPPKMHENVRLANAPLYDAAKGLDGAVKVHGLWTLETTGRLVDTVALVGQELPADTGGLNSRLRMIVANWERTAETVGKGPYVGGGGTVADVFWRLLCGDTEYHKDLDEDEQIRKIGFRRASPATATAAYQEWRKGDQQAMENRRTSIIAGYWQESGGGDEVQIRNAFHHAVECASGDRRIFATSKGYIGTGPSHIREGDDIAILSRSRVPFILRLTGQPVYCDGATREVLVESGARDEAGAIELKRENRTRLIEVAQRQGPRKEVCNDVHRHCYHVVGDAYVQGIMDGEAAVAGSACQEIFLV